MKAPTLNFAVLVLKVHRALVNTQMLKNIKDFKGFRIRATDGELGTINEFYFDDESWAIRYLTVETGGWLGGKEVLISPFAIVNTDWQGKCLDVVLTKKQVENSPNIDTHKPVSRQHEASYLGYYGYPIYWEANPGIVAISSNDVDETMEQIMAREARDSHLRSTQIVGAYNIEALDGEIGHIDGFVIDDEAWAIRYIEVSTRTWWPGKKVLVSPSWIASLTWMDSKAHLALSRERIQSAPAYLEDQPITRDYEAQLFNHYGKPPYWLAGTNLKSFSAAAGTATPADPILP